ncbi:MULTISPECIES: DUF3450 family protein [unclassified Lentimonas]|uniref:DUF3450 family protein n=1 Tax=unclassified Lentimonas TaxID=2630993 RepID=UPI001326C767|nr:MULTISPECIES: DUF3450 family protein [unclassified Lentimonas]CAA6695443.1 Unannotated [Lentimonas sp. CC10]CAA6696616.1 Unannotated [Lentimonas sp. CC19]CAA7071304.1 Unannotated [Lentimonas sp. CC11]
MHHLTTLLISIGIASAVAHADSVDSARTSVSDWVQTEQAISREALDWQADKTLLLDMITIAEKRVATLEQQVKAHETFNSLAQEERRSLIEQDAEIAEYTSAVDAFLKHAEQAIRELLPRLPDPLKDELATELKRLPDGDSTLSTSLNERTQTITAILTQIREFDEQVAIHQTIRALPNSDNEVAVRTIWVGLGQAYYIAPSDAGYGLPSANGWTWHSAPELSNAIQDSIQQIEATASTPQLIDLPIQIKGGTL